MAKKKPAKRETKSDFLRKVLGKNPDLDYQQVSRRWTKAGHPGTISNALFYQFKVTLLDTKPPIWRRIQVADCTLDKLHEHIQTAMGWTNSHLHHFRIG